MSHTITITRLAGDEQDDAEYTVGGSCTSQCLVWRECSRKACAAMKPEYGNERVRHGKTHMYSSEGGWCVETNECGEQYAYDLDLEADEAQETGTYPLEVSWDGDGWIALIDFDHRTPLLELGDPERSTP